jgi:EAL domain-containing protein (putative c-di-GMP-specific phosphodiesterase class I)
MLSGLMSLVRALNMEAIAEGVGTAEQAARLGEVGCKVVQGYYLFSDALPPLAAGLHSSTESTCLYYL